MRGRILAAVVVLGACGEAGWEPIDADAGDGGARAAWIRPGTDERLEVFEVGAPSRVADFLFVLDPSVSMSAVLDDVRAGFDALSDDAAFPDKARVGVMTMIPPAPRAKVGERAVPMPDRAVRDLGWVSALPGFGRMVTADGIAAFKTLVPDQAAAFPHVGCDAWFRPGDVGPDGVPCLVAHTQTVLAPFGVEAGLHTMKLVGGSPVMHFRPGAVVNVIFVSDTHDPGLTRGAEGTANGRLIRTVPSADEVVAAITAAYPVAGVRLHAMAPATECVERWSPKGATYKAAAEASGGVFADLCGTPDHRAFLREVGKRGGETQVPILPLGAQAREVARVAVDGAPVPYTALPGGRAVKLADTPTGEEIEVTYRTTAPAKAPKAAPTTVSRELAPQQTSGLAPTRTVSRPAPTPSIQRDPSR